MRLDHLLSKEKEIELLKILLFIFQCTFLKYIKTLVAYGGIAQLARAPALQAGGQEFDSPCLHHFIMNMQQKEAH